MRTKCIFHLSNLIWPTKQTIENPFKRPITDMLTLSKGFIKLANIPKKLEDSQFKSFFIFSRWLKLFETDVEIFYWQFKLAQIKEDLIFVLGSLWMACRHSFHSKYQNNSTFILWWYLPGVQIHNAGKYESHGDPGADIRCWVPGLSQINEF